MPDEVFCIRHGKNGPAIDAHIPFRGELKEKVLELLKKSAMEVPFLGI